MKIGIITFHREINYGANLQAFALTSFLRKEGFDAELIDYMPNSSIDRRSWKRKLLHLGKIILSHKARVDSIKKRKFRSFQQNHYILSKQSFIGDESFKCFIPAYDVVVSGSDQILNLSLSDNSFAYYLPFFHNHKISYASSFGRSAITDLEKWAVLEYLQSFKKLSFRENSGYEIVNRLIGLNSKDVVLDPVFLLNQDDWQLIANKKSKIKQNYIFVYIMESSKIIESLIKKIASENKSDKIVVLFGTKCNFSIKPLKYKTIETADPTEFLSLFIRAKSIITNSFHGLAFSLIFKKKTYCVAHSKRNDRLLNLLKMIGEEDKMIDSTEKTFVPIDGSRSVEKLSTYIDDSKSFVLNSLKEANEK